MHRSVLIAFALLSSCLAANAQQGGFTPSQTVDLSAYAKTSDLPTAASSVPPVDVYGGAVGAVTNQFPRPDAARPRITRSMVVTLDANGTGTADWSAQPLSAAGVVNLTPIFAGTGAPKCWLTAAATTTTASIKCVIENTAALTLAIITSGITVNSPTAASAMKVNVVVLPPSQ